MNFIKTAKSEIFISIYRFNNKQVTQLIKDIAANGIKVRIMVADKHFKECADIFTQSGKPIQNIEVTYGNRNILVHHNKYILIDKTKAFIMTGNLDNHLGKSTDFVIHTTANDICQNIFSIFKYDWENRTPKPINKKYIFNKSGLYWSDGSTDKKYHIYKKYYSDNVVNDMYFTNHGSSLEAYKEIVEKAKTSIKIYMQLINSFECLEYLCNAADRGVKVEIICQSLGNFRLDAFMKGLLNRHGITIIYNQNHLPYVHAKAIIVDEKIAMLGSMNFSYASTHLNRELDIIITGKELEKLISKFNRDFKSLKSSIVNTTYSFHHPYTDEHSSNQKLD